jgi:4-hydroxy-4-methyl-2-oxoglutarate aldolase
MPAFATVRRSELGFDVFAMALYKGTVKETGRDQPIVIGGVAIHPGDIVSADDDGVVVVPGEHRRRSEGIPPPDEKEAGVMKALREGRHPRLSGTKQVLAARIAPGAEIGPQMLRRRGGKGPFSTPSS